jgi:hypothetical protein
VRRDQLGNGALGQIEPRHGASPIREFDPLGPPTSVLFANVNATAGEKAKENINLIL